MSIFSFAQRSSSSSSSSSSQADPPDSEIWTLKEQLGSGNISGLRSYLTRTRAEEDWQERIHVLSEVISEVRPEILDFACESEPTAADIFLARCAFYAVRARQLRGVGTCDTLQDGRMTNVAQAIEAASADLARSLELDPEDPTARVCLLRVFSIFTALQEPQMALFHQIRALVPDLVPAWRTMVNARSERWGGSHHESIQLARDAMAVARPGSDMAACLFLAHTLALTHLLSFDKDRKAAEQYGQNHAIRAELNRAFDDWVRFLKNVRPSNRKNLKETVYWYKIVRDRSRLARLSELGVV